MSPIMLLALVVVLIIFFVIILYNKMIKLRNRVDEAWSDIDVQLKRRYNLIPNIVETVKGYATHEESVLTQVTEARANAINATNLKDQGAAENMLSGALKSLFAVAENYPNLKANENFMQLQNELVDTEDKIQSARRFYNGVVKDFNTTLQQFPNNIIAGIFKFQDREYFEVENEEEKEVVQVSFDKDKGEEAAPEEPTPEVPTEEAKEEPAPVQEPPAPEPPAPTEEAPEEVSEEAPATCPKCGGEMAEGHVCPVTEPEATPAEEVEEEVKEEVVPPEEPPTPEAPAEAPAPEAPAEEAEKEDEEKTA